MKFSSGQHGVGNHFDEYTKIVSLFDIRLESGR